MPAAEVLSQSPCAKVTRCEGGHLHLPVGPVTESAVFEAVVLTLCEAQRRLHSVPPAEQRQ